MSELRDEQIRLHAVRSGLESVIRDIDATLRGPHLNASWPPGLVMLRGWLQKRIEAQTRMLETTRLTGFIPELPPEPPLEAEARAIIEALPEGEHSVVVESRGRRAVFRVTSWTRPLEGFGRWELILVPLETPP